MLALCGAIRGVTDMAANARCLPSCYGLHHAPYPFQAIDLSSITHLHINVGKQDTWAMPR